MLLPVLPQSAGCLFPRSLCTCRQSAGFWGRFGLLALLLLTAGAAFAQDTARSPDQEPLTTRDPSGWLRTFTPSGKIDHANPFFQSLGTNGRTCNSCHQQHDGWSVSAEDVRKRFDATSGTDPIFRPVDGADSPLDDVSTLEA
ncbi:MAG: hypothetical protein ACREH9_09090, partial [Pseudomonadota bacterium]